MLLFDGDCAFCSSCAALAQRWVRPAAPIVAWQHVDLAAWGLTPQQCEEAVQWVRPGTDRQAVADRRATGHRPAAVDGPTVGPAQVSAGPAAIAELLRSSRFLGWRMAGRTLALAPLLAAAQPVYRWVARHRHQLPGGTAACALPAPGSQGGRGSY